MANSIVNLLIGLVRDRNFLNKINNEISEKNIIKQNGKKQAKENIWTEKDDYWDENKRCWICGKCGTQNYLKHCKNCGKEYNIAIK
jgi:hypothetical protein